MGGFQLHFGAFQRLRTRHAVKAGVIDQNVDRFFEHVEVDFLRHQTDLAHGRGTVGHQVDAEHRDRAGAGVDQRADHPDQGRFAGPVRAEQGEEITGGNVQ